MKILFVEDHLTFGPSMTGLLRGVDGVSDVHLCRGRNRALEALATDCYDLLILDLTIPAEDDDLEIAPENGHAVFYEARKLCPGIKIFVLTGSEMDDFAKGLSRQGDQVDLWGSRNPTNTLDYFEKENADRLFVEVGDVAAQVAALERVVLNTRGRELNLSAGAQRCIRVAARRLAATAVEVVPLSGGLSTARVIRATMRNAAGHTLHATAAKLGTKAEIEVEVSAYHADAKRLPLGFFAPLTETVDKGAWGTAGAFYTLAEGYSRSLFDLLAEDDHAAAAVVAEMRQKMTIWIAASTMASGTIADVRHRLLWPEQFAAVVAAHGLVLGDVEGRALDFRQCCLHGDLHGGNVLVDSRNQPVLIDYGGVGQGPAALDPVMLDLSIAFHPDAVRLGLSAKVQSVLELWPDPDAFVANHPFPQFARACRDWAYDVGGHDIAVLASAYAYVARQLQYEAVDRADTLRLLGSVAARIRSL